MIPVRPFGLHTLSTPELRERLRQRLAGREHREPDVRIGPFPPAVTERIRHRFPVVPRPAASWMARIAGRSALAGAS